MTSPRGASRGLLPPTRRASLRLRVVRVQADLSVRHAQRRLRLRRSAGSSCGGAVSDPKEVDRMIARFPRGSRPMGTTGSSSPRTSIRRGGAEGGREGARPDLVAGPRPPEFGGGRDLREHAVRRPRTAGRHPFEPKGGTDRPTTSTPRRNARQRGRDDLRRPRGRPRRQDLAADGEHRQEPPPS